MFQKRAIQCTAGPERKKTYEQDWEAWKNFRVVTLACIWKDETRLDKRRHASPEDRIARSRMQRSEKAWQVLCGQNVEMKWQEVGQFVRLEQARSL